MLVQMILGNSLSSSFKRHLIVIKYTFSQCNSTTVIAKIKGMPRSLFYVIPRYVTMDYEK